MKTMSLAAVAALLALTVGASAQNNASSYSGLYGTGSNPSSHGVSSYTNNNGTLVQGYRATNPNSTQMDNYSTRGNLNPYTGTYGTRTPRY